MLLTAVINPGWRASPPSLKSRLRWLTEGRPDGEGNCYRRARDNSRGLRVLAIRAGAGQQYVTDEPPLCPTRSSPVAIRVHDRRGLRPLLPVRDHAVNHPASSMRSRLAFKAHAGRSSDDLRPRPNVDGAIVRASSAPRSKHPKRWTPTGIKSMPRLIAIFAVVASLAACTTPSVLQPAPVSTLAPNSNPSPPPGTPPSSYECITDDGYGRLGNCDG